MHADRLLGGSAFSTWVRGSLGRVCTWLLGRTFAQACPPARDFETRYSGGIFAREISALLRGGYIYVVLTLRRVLRSRAQTDCDGVPFGAADSRPIIEARVPARTVA